ncbi:MAG: toll/interleukin-1 receptor domain-containing protein [Bryobacteraceae bacterium]
MATKTVFISHVTAEAEVAEALKLHIERSIPDVTAFASSTDITLGSRWLTEIDNALNQANAVLVVCSPWSVERRWINFEAGAGWGQKKPVIPLCYGLMRTEDLPDLLQALQAVNVHNAADCELLIRNLCRAFQCEPRVGADYSAMAESLRIHAPSRRPVIALDLNHGQRKWPIPPDSQRSSSEQSIFGYAENTRDWKFYPITSGSHFLSMEFWESAGLVVAAPLRSRMSPETINIVRNWVFGGGRLLLLGFELGDLHHGGNLGDLAGQFGIQLGTDIVGPPGFKGEKPYGTPVAFLVSEADPHPLTEGLGTITISNVQTVRVAPGGTEWLRVGRNAVYRPARDTVAYLENTLIQRDSKRCDVVSNVGGTPVAVMAPPGLCGVGAVCAIGTWQIRNSDSSSQTLTGRLLNWLANGQ